MTEEGVHVHFVDVVDPETVPFSFHLVGMQDLIIVCLDDLFVNEDRNEFADPLSLSHHHIIPVNLRDYKFHTHPRQHGRPREDMFRYLGPELLKVFNWDKVCQDEWDIVVPENRREVNHLCGCSQFGGFATHEVSRLDKPGFSAFDNVSLCCFHRDGQLQTQIFGLTDEGVRPTACYPNEGFVRDLPMSHFPIHFEDLTHLLSRFLIFRDNDQFVVSAFRNGVILGL